MPVNYPKQKNKKITPPRKPVRPADVPRRKTMAKPPIRFEDGQIDKNITFLNPETKPKKRLGPVPGSPAALRCVKGGRPARSIEDLLDTASEEFMLKVLKGESFDYQGPTGKRCNGPAPIATRASIASTWLKKRRPDLTASMVQATLQTEDITPENTPSDRELARMIGALVFESQIGTTAEPKAIAAPIDYMNTLPEAEMHSVGAEERGAAMSGDPSPRRKLPYSPVHGQRHDCANGAHIRWYEGPSNTQGRWHVMDKNNIHHMTCYDFDKAIKRAQSLPEPTGAHQSDPWEVQRNMNMAVENLDRRREAEPLGPPTTYRNVQRDPRGAWKPRRQR